jgi:hypothetical protein
MKMNTTSNVFTHLNSNKEEAANILDKLEKFLRAKRNQVDGYAAHGLLHELKVLKSIYLSNNHDRVNLKVERRILGDLPNKGVRVEEARMAQDIGLTAMGNGLIIFNRSKMSKSYDTLTANASFHKLNL